MATKALFFLITSGAVTGELFNEAFDGKLSGNVYEIARSYSKRLKEFSFSECGKSSSCMALETNCRSGEAGCAIASWVTSRFKKQAFNPYSESSGRQNRDRIRRHRGG